MKKFTESIFFFRSLFAFPLFLKSAAEPKEINHGASFLFFASCDQKQPFATSLCIARRCVDVAQARWHGNRTSEAPATLRSGGRGEEAKGRVRSSSSRLAPVSRPLAPALSQRPCSIPFSLALEAKIR